MKRIKIMTQEEKNLVLDDLCGRLPYMVKVDHFGTVKELLGIMPSSENVMVGYDINDYEDSVIEDIKPYLRPMSSMTAEEKKEYNSLCDAISTYHYEFGDIIEDIELCDNFVSIDWLNENMFDYHGLIPKGFAISTEEFNPYKD